MSTHRWIDRICAAVMVLALILTVLFMNGESLGIALVQDTDAESYSGNEYFTANDLNGSWDASGATVITLNGDSAAISGNGAYWLNGSLVIAQSGQYIVSGELTDGNLVVNAAQYSKVWILLNGVNITCSGDACIRIDQADKVFLTLAEGTENTLTGGESFSESALADGVNAVLFSRDDLTINGSGALKIISSCLNGITSKDDLILTGGTLSVTAPGHGIRVNDRFHVTSAALTVTAEQDAIHTEGAVVIQDGRLTLTAGDDAVRSDASVLILGGTLLVTDCYEGIEALTIEIRGGDTAIHSRDDGLNANGYTGTAFGGGMPGNGPMPDAQSESGETAEGRPAPDMQSESGETAEGRPAPDMMQNGSSAAESKTVVSAEDTWILISGGSLTLYNESGSDADGLDSNGNIRITGGTIRISLTGSNGNSALDCGSESGGTAVISGGTVVACGDSSMAEGFDSSSAQASVLYGLSETAAAGSTVVLLNAEGEEILRETIPYSFSSVLLSCPQLTVGETCTIRIGDLEETVEISEVSVSAGETSGAGMVPGAAMPAGGGMGRAGFENGETPPELPEGMENFQPPEGTEGFQPPEGMENLRPPEGTEGFQPPADGSAPFGSAQAPSEAGAETEQAAAAQPAEMDFAAVRMLVLLSVLCLAAGLTAALIWRRTRL